MSAGLLCKWTHNLIICMYVCHFNVFCLQPNCNDFTINELLRGYHWLSCRLTEWGSYLFLMLGSTRVIQSYIFQWVTATTNPPITLIPRISTLYLFISVTVCSSFPSTYNVRTFRSFRSGHQDLRHPGSNSPSAFTWTLSVACQLCTWVGRTSSRRTVIHHPGLGLARYDTW